ncbi:MAG TPA: DUF1501 domain-containing protein [Pyrinomonadaceae bacterium]|jgi:uncharacterized protein (DUF1501 family)|nr:DUF1501 domain-containing protein [Pyrinomonadaceae bacterium]
MRNGRRDFLRAAGCATVGAAFAPGLDSFGALAALAPRAASDYRALVCVFLNGGNDGDNMVVPVDDYASYSNARAAAGLAIPRDSLLALNATRGRQFGLHPSMPDVRDLYNQGRAAALFNVGPLVEPLTRAAYRGGSGRAPVNLFSHSDQVLTQQTSLDGAVGASGWGGRAADRAAFLNGNSQFAQAVTTFNIQRFLNGVNTRPLALGDASRPLNNALPYDQPPGFSGFTAEQSAARRAAVTEALALDRGSAVLAAAGDVRAAAIQTSATLATASPNVTTAFPATQLGLQLQQVARVVALREVFQMKRQIFFCFLEGFDTHFSQRGVDARSQDTLLRQLNDALRAFHAATVELGVADGVTTFTLSDFGRTFDPAGSAGGVGSDHGWGNIHLVVGGSVRGGDFYGTPPVLACKGPDDADDRGRWIPTTSNEQYGATLATWYGVPAADLPAVFPLLNRFSTPNLGFLN